MKRLVRALLLLSALALWTRAGVAATNEVDAAEETVSVAALKAENEALRRENQRLRRELVRRQGGEPVIDMTRKSDGKAVEDPGKVTDDGGYWLATKSMKRHNSKCRYYKMGKGRPCKRDEGTPCQKCGG